MALAKSLVELLRPHVEQIEIAGSLRRGLRKISDVDIVYVPKVIDTKEDMFRATLENRAEVTLKMLLEDGTLEHKPNGSGSHCWGNKNKFAVHAETGIPVNFFETDKMSWINTLFTRTGGKDTNIDICKAALEKGWTFEATGAGFHKTNDRAERHDSTSEKDIFRFVGLDYLEPNERD